jgi:hypothetical protein
VMAHGRWPRCGPSATSVLERALILLVGAIEQRNDLLPWCRCISSSRWRLWSPAGFVDAAWRTLAVGAPAFAFTAWIRYVTRDSAAPWRRAALGRQYPRDPQRPHAEPVGLPACGSICRSFSFQRAVDLACLRLSEKPDSCARRSC